MPKHPWHPCFLHPDGTSEVAVKILEPGVISGNEFSQEAPLMKQIRHSKLIQLYYVAMTEGPIHYNRADQIWQLIRVYLMIRGDGHSLKLPQWKHKYIADGMSYLAEKN